MAHLNAPAKFPLGQLVATANASTTLDPRDVAIAIARHVAGAWGELCEEDRRANEQALADGARLFSVYRDRLRTKFYIITEADRSATTVLLPEDY